MAEHGGEETREGDEEEEENMDEMGAEDITKPFEGPPEDMLNEGETWAPYWEPEWDNAPPDRSYAYERGVLSKESWLDMLHHQPTTIIQFPNKDISIVRVPLTS